MTITRWIVAGAAAVLLFAAVFSVTVWPTLYRYEVKYRCVFEPVDAPFENEFYGQTDPPRATRDEVWNRLHTFLWEERKDAGPWMRVARATVTDEQYKVHRLTGEMYRLEKGKWVLQGIAFNNPQELMDSYNGKSAEGCHRSTEHLEQDSNYSTGPWTVYEPKKAAK